MFIPFGFMAGEAAAWTPADFTDVKYWWTADAGVTDDGSGNVETWTDQIAGFSQQQTTTANMPSITTSATLNGENVIAFNGTSDYLFSTTSPSSQPTNADLTILSVFNLIDVKTGGALVSAIQIGGSGPRFLIDTLNNSIRIFEQNYPIPGSGVATMESTPATTGARALKWRYDSSAGDSFFALDTLTESSLSTGGSTGTNTWSTGVTVATGATLDNTGGTVFSSRYVQVEVAEQVWVETTPSGAEMDEWKTYVNNKYGTIIS